MSLPGWVPKTYLEKVLAIYDYNADKEDELTFQVFHLLLLILVLSLGFIGSVLAVRYCFISTMMDLLF